MWALTSILMSIDILRFTLNFFLSSDVKVVRYSGFRPVTLGSACGVFIAHHFVCFLVPQLLADVQKMSTKIHLLEMHPIRVMFPNLSILIGLPD